MSEKKQKTASSKTVSKTSLPAYKAALNRHLAVQKVAREFFSFAFADVLPAATALKKRDSKIRKAIEAAGGAFDTNEILVLFYLLEDAACGKVNEVAMLVQTTSPEKVKDLLPHLPDRLVNNAQLSREEAVKKSFSKRGKKGADIKEQNRPQEVKDRKNRVEEKWKEWKKHPHLYKSRADFADTVSKEDPDLSRDTIYKKWVPKWEGKKSTTQLAEGSLN